MGQTAVSQTDESKRYDTNKEESDTESESDISDF